MATIRIGTRKSALALAQAEEVSARLRAAWPELLTELVKITTSGDRFTEFPLADIGGKGLFTKEIEEALLSGAIDLAVHSMKDMPTMLPDGLMIAAMLPREDPRDMLIGKRSLADIPQGGTFGTSSLRRAAQLLMLRPDIKIMTLRGNVETRINKISAGLMSATMLARAGLNRLGIRDVTGAVLAVEEFLPAIAQGVIGIECRSGDERTRELLQPLDHRESYVAAACEREFLRVLDGSCRTPIAGYAAITGSRLSFTGLIAKPDGSAHHRIKMEGSTGDYLAIGHEAAGSLLSRTGRNFIG